MLLPKNASIPETGSHVRRKDDGYFGRRMLRMELPGKKKWGRPNIWMR